MIHLILSLLTVTISYSTLSPLSSVIPRHHIQYLHRGSIFNCHSASAMAGEDETFRPVLAIFETFRDELDDHHDRRERIIKASRDITALSKKM